MTTTPCPGCGLLHEVSTEQVVVARDARQQLGAYVDAKGWRRLLVVADANTAEALGDELAADLAAAGHEVATQRFAAREGLLADEDAVGAVRDALAAARPDGVLAVGSGVINDVTRYATFLEGQGYVCVPTAPSMDGYASSVAAMQFDGVKITLPTHAPLAVFADPAVLSAAPPEMIRWGFGDLIGKAAARFDWVLASGLSDEPFCEIVEARVLVPLTRCIEGVEELLAADEEAVVALTTGLIESGLAMAMMGNSRPASGCEHHASHFWDLLAYRGLREHAPHGLQVGYATRFATAVQRASLDRLGDPLLVPAGGGGGPEEQKWFGEQYLALGPVRDEKQMWFARYGDGWPGTPEKVADLARRLVSAASIFDRVGHALDLAGFPADAGYLGVDEVALRATFRYANRLRSRFTVLDLLESQLHLDDVLDEVLPVALAAS
ncbi:MAG: glycerol-phosphate dehydrogenase [Acidimicrobiaceae bacterium]|nr:glycerol-phosphate dehydrogenase [Acidimicrobiaceae bacterium]